MSARLLMGNYGSFITWMKTNFMSRVTAGTKETDNLVLGIHTNQYVSPPSKIKPQTIVNQFTLSTSLLILFQ